MFKLGEMFVAFVGKDSGLVAMVKQAANVSKYLLGTLNTMIAAGGKMGVAAAGAFGKIGVAAAKAAPAVIKSFERIVTAGLKMAAKVTPSVVKGFDKIIGHGTKLTTGVLQSFTKLGLGAMKSGTSIVTAFLKMGSGAGGAGRTVGTAFKGMLAPMYAAQLAATATWAAITGGISLLMSGVGALIGFGKSSTLAASDVSEMGNKFDVVFGKSAPEAREQLTKMADIMGRSRNDLSGYAGSIQDLLVPLGFARDKAAGMSVKVAQLAVDMASFNNKADSEVVDDITAALTGSGEVMKKYGVVVNETTLKQELLKMGFRGSAEDASEQLKALARLNIIIAGTSDAHGDAVRTGGGFANMMKRLYGIFNEISTQIGAIFLPAAESVSAWLAKHSANLRDTIGDTDAWGDSLKAVVDDILKGADVVITVFGNWETTSARVMDLLSLAFETLGKGIYQVAEDIGSNLQTIGSNMLHFFPDLISTIAQVHGSLWGFLKKGWQEIWDYIRSAGRDAINVDLDKILEGVKNDMEEIKFRPFDTAKLNAEFSSFTTSMFLKSQQTAKQIEKLDPLKPFKAADAGIEVKARVKFDLTDAAGFWKKSIEDAFDKQKEKEGLGLQKEAVRIAGGMAQTMASIDTKLEKNLTELTKSGVA